MGCTVRELLARTDSHELAEWMAFFTLDDEESGIAGVPAYAVADTDTGYKSVLQPQSPERQISIAQQIHKAIGQQKRTL